MTHRQAFKRACKAYAEANKILVPKGFNLSDAYGEPARTLTKRIQKRNKLVADGNMTPETLLVVGRYLPGASVGARAVWAMRCVEGPLETISNNVGRYVQMIQRLGSELAPGPWPWCAAATSWALRCAGWKSWAAFCKNEHEAWVPAWTNAALAGRYGMSVQSWRTATTGDVIAFKWNQPVYQHIGMVVSRPNQVTSVTTTIEGNTGDASADDGDGLWRRTRKINPPQMVIRIK